MADLELAIELQRALEVSLTSDPFEWEEDDVILYNLAIGAGADPVDPSELRYTYEGDLHVLPTFATIPPFGVVMGVIGGDGFDIDLSKVLHGEQETEIHQPIPTSGAVISKSRVVDIYDKGRGALVVVEATSTAIGSSEPMFTNRSSLYIRGEGGFGGDAGPGTPQGTPTGDPDHVIESATLPQQALLYRLSSGDKNPLHADPGFAAFAGYERPILHGLCTFGIVNKAVVDSALNGEVADVGLFRGRFSGVVFPGETIETRIWDRGGQLLIDARCKERDTPVLTNGLVERR